MILFLISDTPLKDGNTDRYFHLIDDIAKKVGLQYEKLFVHPEYKYDITKTDILKYLQNNLNFIEKTHPKIIVAMGREAFMMLNLASTSVSSICSIPQHSPLFGGIVIDERKKTTQKNNPVVIQKYMPRGCLLKEHQEIELVSHKDILIYPTYTYKNMLSYASGYKGQAFFERQLNRVKDLLASNTIYDENTFKHKVKLFYKKEDVPEAIQTLDKWKNTEVWAFDIETAGYTIPKEAQLSFRHTNAEISMIAIGTNQESHVYNTHHLPELIPHIKSTLENKGKHLSWNGRFDIEFLRYLWNVNFDKHVHIDGRACLYLVDMNMQFLGKGASTLKLASSVFLPNGASYAGYQKDSGIDEAIKEGNGSYLAENELKFMTYCGIDVLQTFATVKLLWGMLNTQERSMVTQYYETLSETLNQIHKEGIRVDTDKMEMYINQLKEFISSMEKKITEMYPINPKSTKDLAKVIYEIRKLPVHYTERGNESVSIEILESYPNDEFCKLIADYRGFLKQLEIFEAIKKYVHNGYCYPTYNQYRTTSGRLSSTEPPIHIVPKNKKIISKIRPNRPIWPINEIDKNGDFVETSPNFKEIFIPDTGYTLIYSDYSQLEIYVLANYINGYSKDKTLQEVLKKGRDIHSYTASLLYTVITGQQYTEEFITKNKKVEPYASWRQDAKSVIFKLMYGGTYKSFARDKNIPDAEAKRIFDLYLQFVPGIVDYMNHQEDIAKEYKKVCTYAGHARDLKIYEFERYNSKSRNIALNHPIQGTASYIVNVAMIELNQRIRKIEGRILLTVHDSIATQVPNGKLEEGIKIQKECKLNYTQEKFNSFLHVPLKLEIFYGKNWHELKEWK